MGIRFISLAGAILLAPSALMAAAAQAPASHGDWYLGIGAGPTSFFNKVSNSSNASANYGVLGALASLYGGYNYTFTSGFGLGGEVFGDVRSPYYKDNNSFNPSYKARLRYTYGLRVLPGYQFNSTVSAHAILGYVRGNMRSTAGGYSHTSNLTGYQLGLGADYMATQHVGLRGDLIYSNYNKASFNIDGVSFKNWPSTMDAVLSVFYSFY